MTASNILAIVGTRPEIIKMAPVIRALRTRAPDLRVELCAVSQQKSILDEALHEWKLEPDHRVTVDRPGSTPPEALAAMQGPLAEVVAGSAPNWVVVQGDTTTTLAGARAAVRNGCRLAHVEAGLRSGDPRQPYPEELYRTLVDQLADVHYAPTPTSRDNLLAEGRRPDSIAVVGNTVIDSLEAACSHPVRPLVRPWEGRRLILVTGHRRESFGVRLEGLCRALRRVALEREDIHIVYVLHPNPGAHGPALRLLSDLPRVELLEPLGYRRFVQLMKQCHYIVTDSGGIQEEAPCLGRPVLVTRDRTERPEAVSAGVARVIGFEPETVWKELHRLLDDDTAHARMARRVFPFGEPGAARRICDDLAGRCRRAVAS